MITDEKSRVRRALDVINAVKSKVLSVNATNAVLRFAERARLPARGNFQGPVRLEPFAIAQTRLRLSVVHTLIINDNEFNPLYFFFWRH